MKPFTITVATPELFNALDYALTIAQSSIQSSDYMDKDAEPANKFVGQMLNRMKGHRNKFKIPSTPQYQCIWQGKEDDAMGKNISRFLREERIDYVINLRGFDHLYAISVLSTQALNACAILQDLGCSGLIEENV